jgi:uncharacterized protein YggE
MRTVISFVSCFVVATTAFAAQPDVPMIVAAGEAVVRKAPDAARLGVSVETRARTSREAQSANAEIAAAVLRRIAALGIGSDALRTASLRVEQEFDYNNGRRTPRGYVARNSIEVRVDDVTKVGEVSDALIQAGATSIEGVRFELKDAAAAEREALRLAVADARARADAMAAGAGRAIDRILKIEESRATAYDPRPMVAVRATADAATTPVEPGFIDVRAHVTLTVAIK